MLHTLPGAMALLLSSLAASDPAGLAVVDGDREFTWSEANSFVNRATNALLAMDLAETRRISVFARNAAEVVLLHFAALCAGVSSVPTSSLLGSDELAYILTDSDAGAVFAGPETLDVAVAAARSAGVRRVVAWRVDHTRADDLCTDDVRVQTLDSLLSGVPDEAPTTWQEPRLPLLYTSGTTGRPKGTHIRTFPPALDTVAEWIPTLGPALTAAGKAHLVVGPLHHTGPFISLRYFASGSTVVVLQRFDAEQLLALIDRYRVATSLMVPTHFTRLLALPKETRDRFDVSSLEWVAHTGAATPIEVKRAMIEWFGPVLSEAYGASESGTVCSISSTEWLEHEGSVGRCTPGFDVLVLDDEGNELPRGAAGRLFFVDKTGRGIVYHNDPAKTQSVHIRPGVFTIGEVGYVDADGYVFITDRTSDMVVSGGVNIYPAEAEQVLVQHPGVRDCGGVGVPNPDLGEELRMLVEPADPAAPPSIEELAAFCRDRLAGYKCPKSYEIVESVGRTVMGKLDKRSLRRPYWPTDRTIG